MVQPTQDGLQRLRDGRTLFGPGWKAVDNFDDLSDIDEYESDEEETYVTLDLGAAVEPRSLMTETDYQLIGLDTPLPFLRLNNQIYQGDVASLVGDEVILGLKRNHENPHHPSHPPVYSTNKRIIFHPVTLKPLHQDNDAEPALSQHAAKMRKRVLGAPNLRGRTKRDDKRSGSESRVGTATPGAVDFTLGAEDTAPAQDGATATSSGDLPPVIRTNNEAPSAPVAAPVPVTAPAPPAVPPTSTAEGSMDIDQPEAGPSTPSLAEPRKKLGRKPKPNQDIVINALEEWYGLDISAAPAKAKVFLSPGVDLSQIGHGLKDDQRILTQTEVIKIKSGIPLSGKGSRGPRKSKGKDKEGSAQGDGAEGQSASEGERSDGAIVPTSAAPAAPEPAGDGATPTGGDATQQPITTAAEYETSGVPAADGPRREPESQDGMDVDGTPTVPPEGTAGSA